MLSRRYQLLLLAIILLAVFFPTIFAEVNSADDRGMIARLHTLGNWSLFDLFFSYTSGVGYYRPLLILTYYLDKEIWSLSANMMHLENVLLHLINALLVYAFARKLLPESDRQTSFAPLVAAFCFALHPLAVEPVSWISGRTDVLAGTFVLMSAVALLEFKLENKRIYGLLAMIALVLGMLSKEVALGFVPGAILLLNAKKYGQEDLAAATGNFRARVKMIAASVVLVGGALLFFFGLRTLSLTSKTAKVGMTLKFMFNDLYHTLFVFLRAFGFYLKKLYWPFPLNFAILEIDPLYELLAIPLVLLCLWIVSRRTLLSATFIAGLFLIVPAFPIAFGQIAWTPYAERYVYVASAFVSIASVMYLREQFKKCHYPLAVKLSTLLFILLMGVATFQRTMIMRTNFTLYADTVQKSPDFNIAWNELGDAYCQKNDLVNAEICFRKASSLYSFSYDEMYDLNLAKVLFEQGKYKEAEDVYAKIFKKGVKSQQALKHYEEFLQRRHDASPQQALSASSAPDPS